MKPHLLAESHRLQMKGEDYQWVAIDIASVNDIPYESDDYTRLQSSPDPGCDCEFCRGYDWKSLE